MTPRSRGDIIVERVHAGAVPTRPEGFSDFARVPGFVLRVRPGWGTVSTCTERGAIAICGSTVEPLGRITARIVRELIDTRTELTTELIGRFFAGVVGHFAAVVAGEERLWAVTDHLGSIPVYVAHTEDRGPGERFSTDLRCAAGVDRRLDEVSVREFIASGRIAAPYTIFESVRRLEPATVQPIGTDDDLATYWRPPAPEETIDVKEAALDLRTGLQEILAHLRSTTPACSLMYSGGEDARSVGALARKTGIDVNGVIFLDHANRELRHARLTARLSGVGLEVRRREPDHDRTGLSDRVALCDPGIDLLHAHSHRLISADDPRPVLDGWFAAPAKADDVRQQRRTWRGVPLGFAHASGDSRPAPLVGDPEIATRWADKATRLLGNLPTTAQHEWLEYFPASDSATFGFFAFNQHSFRSLSPLAMHPIVELVARVPVDFRLNRRLFKLALGGAIGPSAWVPRTDGEILALSPRLDLAATAANKTMYKVSDRLGRRSNGPWQTNAVRRAAAARALDGCNAEIIDELGEMSPHVTAATPSHGVFRSQWQHMHRAAQLATFLEHYRALGPSA